MIQQCPTKGNENVSLHNEHIIQEIYSSTFHDNKTWENVFAHQQVNEQTKGGLFIGWNTPPKK